MERLTNELNPINDVQKWRYDDSNFSSLSEGILGHDDVTEVAAYLLRERKLFRLILGARYPFIFVDEARTQSGYSGQFDFVEIGRGFAGPLGRASQLKAIENLCKAVPTVIFDSNVEEFGVAFIGSDNFQFTNTITDFLCRTGAPPVFFEMSTPANPNTHRRRQSYL